MISLISNHKHSRNMKREAMKVVAMFYIRVPPPVVLLVFQVLATI
jgi:hypothetical protein